MTWFSAKTMNTLHRWQRILVASMITTSVILTSGCVSALAKRGSSENNMVGTYYGGNKSVLILKADGDADYYYSGQNDVKHSNRWSVSNNEITINLSWMFCTVKGTIESDPTSFVLVGASNLDDVLWDDERFTKVSDSTSAMTKDDCDVFIAENSGSMASAEDYQIIDFHGVSVPVPQSFTLMQNNSANMQWYSDSTGYACYALGYIPTNHTLGDGEFGVATNTSVDSFSSLLGQSEIVYTTNTTVGEYAAKEFEIAGVYQNTNAHLKGDFINYSQHGFVMYVMCVYTDDTTYVLDNLDYTISYMQTHGPNDGDGTDSSQTESSSTNIREVLDQYELFMNDYIDFMRNYSNASPDQMLAMTNDYVEMMSELAEMQQMIDDLDVDSMTPEDYAYYIEVTTRVEQNLLSLYSSST